MIFPQVYPLNFQGTLQQGAPHGVAFLLEMQHREVCERVRHLLTVGPLSALKNG
jgi:hypothetical protein